MGNWTLESSLEVSWKIRPNMSFCQGIVVEGLGDRKALVRWGGVAASV